MYRIYAYFDRRNTALAEIAHARTISELPEIVWAYLANGHFVEVENDRNGKTLKFNRDNLSYETLEYGLDVSDFKALSGPSKKKRY